MDYQLIQKGFIPLDKSWIIRMGVLDLFNGYDDIVRFLASQSELSDDLIVLRNVCMRWEGDRVISVGESGTLYRFLSFGNWKFNLGKELVVAGTLKNRDISKNNNLVGYPLSRLLSLDNRTSQWASASVLFGNTEKVNPISHKLGLTYEAVKHWHYRRKTRLRGQSNI